MLLTCYVADADPFARRLLCDAIARDANARIVGATSDERDMMRELRALRPDAVFVEARMSADIVQSRRRTGTPLACHLVLVSALPADAAAAVDCGAADFVLKPCSRARVMDALARVRRRRRFDGVPSSR